MRGLVARLRSSRAVAFYRRLDGTSEQDGMPWMITTAEEGDAAATTTEGSTNEPSANETSTTESTADVAAMDVAAMDVAAMDEPVADEPAAVAPPAIDSGLVPALNRVADAFERMAASIEVEHHYREARLEAVERLLHELVTGLVQPTAVPPVVVGGSIDLEAGHDGHDRLDGDELNAEPAAIDLSDHQLELDDSDDVPLDSA